MFGKPRLVAAIGAGFVLLVGVCIWVGVATSRKEDTGSGSSSGSGSLSGGGRTAPVAKFVPKPDPACAVSAAFDPSRGATLKLPDGVEVHFPAGASTQPVAVSAARLQNDPGAAGVERLLSPVYDVKFGAGDGQPDAPVRISVLLDRARVAGVKANRLALARWDGQEWRPTGSQVDLTGGTASAQVLHLSQYGLVETDRFEPGPARVGLYCPLASAVPLRPVMVPQGAVASCTVHACYLTQSLAKMKVRAKSPGSGIDFGDGTGKFTADEGVADMRSVGGSVYEAHFFMRVQGGAQLGVRDIELIGDEKPVAIQQIAVIRPMVVIVDLDGMRRDLFYDAIQNRPGDHPNLRQLVGPAMIGPQPAGPLAWTEFEHAVALQEATTIFPTVTTVGQASIFSGSDVRDIGICGNQYVDRRKPCKYGFCGYDLADTAQAQFGRYVFLGEPLNSNLLRIAGINTVYEDAKAVHGCGSVVYNNMYSGDRRDAARWVGLSTVEAPQYYFVATTRIVDRRMARTAALDMLRYQTGAWDASYNLGIATLYFCGMDHVGHEGSDPESLVERHRSYLVDTMDPSIGAFMDSLSDVILKSTTFVLCADHGQVDIVAAAPPGVGPEVRCFAVPRTQKPQLKIADLLYEMGYSPEGKLLCKIGDFPGDVTLGFEDATASVGLNGGMAHVYLRREKEGNGPKPRPGLVDAAELKRSSEVFDRWNQPPRWVQVLEAASVLQAWNRQGWSPQGQYAFEEPKEYRNSLELILVRNAESAPAGDATAYRSCPYRVYLDGQQTADIVEWLRTDTGKKFLTRNGWHADDRDAQFVADRISRMNGPLSGDIILIPTYPGFYFEPAKLNGEHGGISRPEFEVPFVIARPAAGEQDRQRFKQILTESVRLESAAAPAPCKNRPSTTDIKNTVLALLKVPDTESAANAGQMRIRLFPQGEIKPPVDRTKGMADSVVITTGNKTRDVLPSNVVEETLGLSGYVNDSDAQVGCIGTDVEVKWRGRTLHTRTAPSAGGDEPGAFNIELPLERGPQTLEVSVMYGGKRIARSVSITYALPERTTSAAEEDFRQYCLTPEKLKEMAVKEKAQLEKEFDNARQSNKPEWIDDAFQRRKQGGLTFMGKNVPYSLMKAIKAGHTKEAVELWAAARSILKEVFDDDLAAVAGSAGRAEELRRRNMVSDLGGLLFDAACVQWQEMDLDGAHETLQTYHKLMTNAYGPGAKLIDALTRYRADPSYQLAHNRMMAGDLPAAVRHFEEFSKRLVEQKRAAGEWGEGMKAGAPTWYPSEKQVQEIMKGGGAPK